MRFSILQVSPLKTFMGLSTINWGWPIGCEPIGVGFFFFFLVLGWLFLGSFALFVVAVAVGFWITYVHVLKIPQLIRRDLYS